MIINSRKVAIYPNSRRKKTAEAVLFLLFPDLLPGLFKVFFIGFSRR
ncbi:hypothetical protein CSB67_2548 [Enterobacter hormaechei]|nr:hypothetical protein CSB67_2548 [Enterobacter hormaechei]